MEMWYKPVNKVKPSDVLIVVTHAHREPWSEIALSGQCKTWIPQLLQNEFNIGYAFSNKLQVLASSIDLVDMRLRYNCGPHVSTWRNLLNRFALNAFQNFVPKVKPSSGLFGIEKLLFLESPIPDLYLSSRWKRLSILEFFIKSSNFKYLVFTTSSSYINGNQLIIELQDFPAHCFGGRVMNAELADSFISGSLSVYDREVAKELLSERREMSVNLLDDLSFGRAQRKLRLSNYEMSSLDISDVRLLESIDDETLNNTIHFRLKSQLEGIRQDKFLMQKLHKRFNNV
jgi:hypothetical protein